MQSSCAQRGQGPCPGCTAVPSRAKLDPGEGRGLLSRPGPSQRWGAEGPGGCSKPHKVVSTGVRGSTGPAAQACPPLCRRRWRWTSQGELDLLTEEELSWGRAQRPGPRDSERRPLVGPEREEAGKQVRPLRMRGLGPGP